MTRIHETSPELRLPRSPAPGGPGREAPRSLASGALRMQQGYGNRAVRRLLQPAAPSAAPALSVQRLIDRKQTEREARDVMVTWVRAGAAGNQKYTRIAKPYEALLAGLDDYQAFIGKTVVGAYEEKGPEAFAKDIGERLAVFRDLATAVALADESVELKEVVNLVLASIKSEEATVDGIVKTFSTSVPMLAKSGWNAQFAGKTYKRATEIAKFALPMYQGGYSQERAFIRMGGMARGMPNKGYKLHVSIHEMTQAGARDTLMPFLAKLGYMHKIAADVGDLAGPQVGKVVTIYPKVEDEATKPDGFDALIAAIEKEADGWSLIPGPAVPGETPMGKKGLVYQEKDAKYLG